MIKNYPQHWSCLGYTRVYILLQKKNLGKHLVTMNMIFIRLIGQFPKMIILSTKCQRLQKNLMIFLVT